MIVEGMSFTVRTESKFPYCVTATGEHIHSTECNAIYATLAFAGIDLLLAFLSAISVTVAIQLIIWRYKNRCAHEDGIQRIPSPREQVEQVPEGGEASA